MGNPIPLSRLFTTPGQDVLSSIPTDRRPVLLKDASGQVLYECKDVEAPIFWSDNAVEIMASKYFRKAGVPGPGYENSVLDVIRRVAAAIQVSGQAQGYFQNQEEGDLFYQELCYLLVYQKGAFNSPVWFNVGLYEQYGITGGKGTWAWDAKTNQPVSQDTQYQHPGASACFILPVEDSLESIYKLVQTESKVFKQGSGAGSNFSAIRGKGEKLSSGGTSSGLLSFLEVLDKSAGAIKSAGATRRAAKLVCVDDDHPDLMDFITWKVKEEEKAEVLLRAGIGVDTEGRPDFNGAAYQTVSGQNANNSVRVTDAFMHAVRDNTSWQLKARTTGQVVKELPAREIFRAIAESAWRCADPGLQFTDTIDKWHTCPASGPIRGTNPCLRKGQKLLTPEGYVAVEELADLDSVVLFDGRESVEGRVWKTGTRPIVRVHTRGGRTLDVTPDHRLLTDDGWLPAHACSGRTVPLVNLGEVYQDSWRDTGRIDFIDRIEDLHEEDEVYDFSCPSTQMGVVSDLVVHNCAEFVHLDNTACNLFSLNLVTFLRADGTFDLEGYEHACYIAFLAQDILVDYSSYPTKEICQATHDHRPLGLGVCNLGGLLMRMGIPYDSVEGRDIGSLLYAVLTAQAYVTSAYLARRLSPFAAYQENRSAMQLVMKRHSNSQRLNTVPGSSVLARILHHRACELWSQVLELGSTWGFRNSQASLAAPTGTVGLMMDADTLSIEPDFCLVKHKRLAGGGFMKIVNQSVSKGLSVLGYNPDQVDEICQYVSAHGTLEGCPGLDPQHLPVFDCAVPGGKGVRSISAQGHVGMVAALAPFVSGSASKTINLPHSATVEDIEQVYWEAWVRGVKCISVYRDGSKSSQPLSSAPFTQATPGPSPEEWEALQAKSGALAEALLESQVQREKYLARIQELEHQVETQARSIDALEKRLPSPLARPKRRELPARRPGGFTHKARIGGTSVYIRTGQYPDGSLGEVFLDMHREGSFARAMLGNFAIAVSIGLQHGTPLESYVQAFSHTKFEPNGITDHETIRMASSVLDFIFRLLAEEYLAPALPLPSPGEEVRMELRVVDAQGKETVLPRTGTLKASMESELVIPSQLRVVSDPREPNPLWERGFTPPAHVPLQFDLGGGQTNGVHKTSARPTGEICTHCGFMMTRVGTCFTCSHCGNNTGCG